MDFIKETLDWVNRERAARGLGEPLEDLPLGRRACACLCPLAVALNADVDAAGIQFHDSDDYEDLPEFAQQFVYAFDDGRLPQYDKRA